MSTVLQAIEAVISQGIGAMRKLSLTSGDYSVLSTDKVRAPQLIDWSRRYGRLEPVPGILSFAGLASGGSTNWNCVHPKGQNGAPLYVRVGSGGAIQTSPTGAAGTWTTQASGVSVKLNAVTYQGAAGISQGFWAGGANGTFLHSADGITWTSYTSTNNRPVNNILWLDALNGVLAQGADGFFDAGWYYTTDGGVSWTYHNRNAPLFAMVTTGGSAIYTVGGSGSTPVAYYSSSLGQSAVITTGLGSNPLYSLVLHNGVLIAAGANGAILTAIPAGSSTTWTARTSGTTESLRLFVANGRVYAVGSNGVSLESSDNGATWAPGPSTGVSTFLRFGIHDPSNPSRAIVVGDSGVTLAGGHGFQLAAYTSPEERDAGTGGAPSDPVTFAAQTGADATMSIPGVLSAKVTGVAPEDLPLSFDVEISPHTTGYHFDYAAANLLDPASWPAGHAVARFDFLEDARDEVHRIVAHDTFATPLVFRGWPPAEADVSPEDLARRFRDDIARMMNALRPALQEAGMVLLSNPQYPRAIPRLVRARPVEAQVLYTLIWRQPAPRPLAPA